MRWPIRITIKFVKKQIVTMPYRTKNVKMTTTILRPKRIVTSIMLSTTSITILICFPLSIEWNALYVWKSDLSIRQIQCTLIMVLYLHHHESICQLHQISCQGIKHYISRALQCTCITKRERVKMNLCLTINHKAFNRNPIIRCHLKLGLWVITIPLTKLKVHCITCIQTRTNESLYGWSLEKE